MRRGSKDPILLTEYVRHRLARQICTRYRNAEGELYVVALDPALEDRIRAGFEHTRARAVHPHVAAGGRSDLPGDRRRSRQADARASHTPIVLVSPQIRAAVKQLTENHLPQLVVLSFNEITRDTKIVTRGHGERSKLRFQTTNSTTPLTTDHGPTNHGHQNLSCQDDAGGAGAGAPRAGAGCGRCCTRASSTAAWCGGCCLGGSTKSPRRRA